MPRTGAQLVLASAVLAFVLASVTDNRAAETRGGDWTIGKSDHPGEVEFSLIEHHRGGTSNHSSDWPVGSFRGIDFSQPGRQEVHFTIARDAGRMECQGFLHDGEGAGLFHFQPDSNYARQMDSLGFPVNDDQQFDMAVVDVSLDFARQMNHEHLANLDTGRLIAFRIFGVDATFIEALRAQGLQIRDGEKLVAFRIHGVTPEMVRSLHQAGYSPDEEMLIAMRIHGATPEWVDELKQRGYEHVDLEKLIAFRIHGVSPEFIGQLQSLGYAHPQPDELIALRIHNVTPEYISDLRSRGLHDLSVDQLVSLRIHGID